MTILLKDIPAGHLQKALLPVLGLCTKKDTPGRAFFSGALCIRTYHNAVEFGTTDERFLFLSTLSVGQKLEEIEAVFRPSKLSGLAPHLKTAKNHITLTLEIESAQANMSVTNEFGVAKISDEPGNRAPRFDYILRYGREYFTAECDTASAAHAGNYNPAILAPVLNALKGVPVMNILFEPQSTMVYIRAACPDAPVRYEAGVAGM